MRCNLGHLVGLMLATLQADFQAIAEPPPVKRRRRPGRFRWINRVEAMRKALLTVSG